MTAALQRLPLFLGSGKTSALAYRLFFHRGRTRAPRRTLRAVPKLPYIDLEFIDGPAEGIAMHSQFAGGAALVTLVFLKDGENKTLLELTHALGVEDVAFVHLQNQCFQLIFHGWSLSSSTSGFDVLVRQPCLHRTFIFYFQRRPECPSNSSEHGAENPVPRKTSPAMPMVPPRSPPFRPPGNTGPVPISPVAKKSE